jgi:choline kinase
MTYILLVAGKGTRLNPITLTYPKCLFKLDEDVTVIERMVYLIKKHDKDAEIILVTGFMCDVIKGKFNKDVTYIHNPFYSITNSIASLWFARDYFNREQITIINGDIVMSEEAVKEVICKKHDKPLVLLDSSIKADGDYNVDVNNGLVVVMSKNLKNYCGEYAGVTILTKKSAADLFVIIEEMINEELFNEWYEDAVVRMIFRNNYKFYCYDICDYEWAEIDSVDDLNTAKKIQGKKALFNR